MKSITRKKKAEWNMHITRSKLKGKTKDRIIQALLNAMYWCYSDPDARLSAREIADYLNGKFLALGSTSSTLPSPSWELRLGLFGEANLSNIK